MIYVTGDLHGSIDISKLNSKNFKEQKNLKKTDYVIVCGDFGCIWDGSNTDRYWIKWLENKSFTTLFIDGNHENFNLLYRFPIIDKFEGEVGRISDSIFHLKRGEIYTIEDKKVFAFGGAESNDIAYRVKNVSWWEEEMPSLREMNYGLQNLLNHEYDIDIVISHTCPEKVFNSVSNSSKKITELELYLEKVRLLLDDHCVDYHWYFGHFHKDLTIYDRFHCMYNSVIKLK